MRWIGGLAFVLLGFWEPSFWFALPMFFWGCETCACVEDCACTDDYSASGTGGAGRSCEFTGGDLLSITGGELVLTSGSSIVFASNGPDTNLQATTVLTIVCQPSDSDGPSTIQLRAGIDGSSYVYGQLAMTGGNVTLSVGTNAGELESNDDAGTGGIAEFITLELCYKPSVDTGTTASGYLYGADIANGDPEWEADGVVENILDYPDTTTYCSCGSLGDNQTSGPVGVEFYPALPEDSTITEIILSAYCEEDASPANGIEDSEATVTAGGTSLSNKATNTAIPGSGGGQLSYNWSGGDLTGVTATNINLFGISGAMAFHMPLGSGGGTQPNVYYMLLTVKFTAPIRLPGRITLTYTKGVTVECVTAQALDTEGGGFPGLAAIADTWDVTSTAIECNSESCAASCGDPVDCASDCCDEAGSDGFTEEMTVSGFTTGVSACCSHNEADYTLEFNAFSGGGCLWRFGDTVDECEPFEDGNSFWITARLYSPVPASGDCLWEVVATCFDGLDLSFAITYRSDPIVGLECDAFPITLDKFSEVNPDGVTVPASITLDNT